jgi:hypothetical protein
MDELNPLFNRLRVTEEFNTFWDEYPRKDDYIKAFYLFSEAVNYVTAENILTGLGMQKLYVKKLNIPFVWRKPSAWLEQECWKNYFLEESN